VCSFWGALPFRKREKNKTESLHFGGYNSIQASTTAPKIEGSHLIRN
jgi:hypothetical protein